MRRARCALIAAAVGAVSFWGGYAVHAAHPPAAQPKADHHARCWEDQPCYPLGVRLQTTAGDRFEVIYDPRSGVYTVEPNTCATDAECAR